MYLSGDSDYIPGEESGSDSEPIPKKRNTQPRLMRTKKKAVEVEDGESEDSCEYSTEDEAQTKRTRKGQLSLDVNFL